MESLCPEDRAILNSLFNPLLPLGEGVVDDAVPHQQNVPDIHAPPSEEARQLNVAGVEATQEGRTEDALQHFEATIASAPDWPAPYNDRAQLYRLMRREEEAIQDLEKAIKLSGGQGSVGCQAFTQRGLLHRLRGEDDPARKCFKQAADLGSSFAKTQLVSLNPMAALCNQMLVKMVGDVRGGVEQD